MQEPERDLVVVGDIAVTQHWIRTPRGVWPLAGSRWEIQDHRSTTSRVPGWAIVLAIFGIPFSAGFSLFFLLARDQVEYGSVEVSVTGPGFYHSTQLVAPGSRAFINISDISARVAYVRSLTATLDSTYRPPLGPAGP